jgi:hypothetical protein
LSICRDADFVSMVKKEEQELHKGGRRMDADGERSQK